MTQPAAGADASGSDLGGGLTVYERVKSLILTQRIAPDTKVNIDRLARGLGVSQTPVREAVQRLEGDGLVHARRKPRGYWTTPLLDEVDLHHLFEVRLLIEPWTTRTAAADRAVNPGRALLAEIDRFAAGSPHMDPAYHLTSHDTAFHDVILRTAGNRFLTDAYRQLHAHLHLFRLYPADLDGSATLEEHRRIADAVIACDAEAAEAAMRTHLMAAMHRFSAGFSSPVRPARALEDIRADIVRSSSRSTDPTIPASPKPTKESIT